jgi:hypothetical protein
MSRRTFVVLCIAWAATYVALVGGFHILGKALGTVLASHNDWITNIWQATACSIPGGIYLVWAWRHRWYTPRPPTDPSGQTVDDDQLWLELADDIAARSRELHPSYRPIDKGEPT